MRKTSGSRNTGEKGLLSEYRFDYRKARPNRFVPRLLKGRLIIALEPDIARVFRTPEAVKRALRAVIAAMPRR